LPIPWLLVSLLVGSNAGVGCPALPDHRAVSVSTVAKHETLAGRSVMPFRRYDTKPTVETHELGVIQGPADVGVGIAGPLWSDHYFFQTNPRSLRVRRNVVVVGDVELDHGTSPIISA
jgi:hypothetical protein